MGIYTAEEIIAYMDEEGVYCEDCAKSRIEQDIPLKPILNSEIEEDMVVTCDCCGDVIEM